MVADSWYYKIAQAFAKRLHYLQLYRVMALVKTRETISDSQCLIVEWKQKKTMELESTNIYLSNICFTG
jgi:tRNA A37 threonylcarbamoyladenosine biosynthesis protein TsaE